jgi:integrase
MRRHDRLHNEDGQKHKTRSDPKSNVRLGADHGTDTKPKTSGSGKTHLITKISELLPPEDVITLTRVTDSSFYNYGRQDLQNKLVVLEDLDGLKEEALLAFKELQSRGRLTSSTSIKDENGNIKGVVRTVEGPVASLAATTRGEIYEDNLSRCLIVAVDETEVQTKAVIDYQNRRAAGLIDTEKESQLKTFLRDLVDRSVRMDKLYSAEQLQVLAEEKWSNPRNGIIVGLLVHQALMVSEVVALLVGDVDLSQGEIYVRESVSNRARKLPLLAGQVLELQVLMADRSATEHLILTRYGKALQAASISRTINSHRPKDHRFLPSRIRQSVIAHKLQAGHDTRIVQAFAGHRQLSTTEGYKQDELERLRAGIIKYHPLR